MDSGERGMNPVAMTISLILGKKILAEPRIGPATSFTQVQYATDFPQNTATFLERKADFVRL